MNDFKFFKGETITDPFQSVPENFRVESVGPILYSPFSINITRKVYCRHIVNPEQTYAFDITETHWLWDFVPTN
jgi:hypothetical protein